jgi:NAD/NADP transhydrogenase alpha subunit
MDVLSSQANLAGYRAVIDAAAEYGRALPMMMTAAGTVPAMPLPNGGASSRALTTLLAARHARHLAGRAQTLQDARKPMHTDPCTI